MTFRVVVLMFAAACQTATAKPAAPSCVDDEKPFDVAALKARLSALADPALDGRASGTAGERAARKLITARFSCLGLEPAGDSGYEQAFTDSEGNATANLVAKLPGKSDEIVVVGAHHDHLGNGYLGANDNGSGVVGVLAIAQAMRQRDAQLQRTVVFVTFSAEEQGLVGSSYFVAHPPAAVPLDKVVEYINLDMLGSHSSKGAVYAFGAFPKLTARAVLQKVAKSYPKINVGIGGNSVRGDHLDFCKQGIPYVFLWTPDARCYHEKCDTADRIDYKGLSAIAGLATGLVEGLADSAVDLAAERTKRGCGVPK